MTSLLKNTPLLSSPEAASAQSFSLSDSQERLWFLNQSEPNITAYHVSIAVRLSGRLDNAALEASFNDLIAEYNPLRAAFVDMHGRPTQNILSAVRFSLSEVNAVDLAEAAGMAAEFVRLPFDLAQPPLFRAQLARVTDSDYLLTLVAHALVLDRASLVILLHQLAARYEVHLTGMPGQPIQNSMAYLDFVRSNPELTADLDYWTAKLADAELMLDLPTDRPRPATQTFRGAAQDFSLSADLTRALSEFSSAHHIALSSTLLAAFFTLAYRYTAQEDLLIGVQTRSAQWDGAVGPFADLQVIRMNLVDKPEFGELARRVDAALTEAQAHAGTSFARLLEALNPGRDLSRQPVVQVAFEFDPKPLTRFEFGGLHAEPVALPKETGLFDLTLALQHRDGELAGAFEYLSDLFQQPTMERAVGHLQTLLHGAVTDAHQPVTHLPLLTEQERHQILIEWNDTEKVHPKNDFVYRLFEMQAARRPDAIAATDADEQVTYRELNARANRLAHFLVESGIQADTLVALLADRSIDFLTGMLAINKAGGAFLPMDPRHPEQRLAQVLELSRTPLILTSTAFQDKVTEAFKHMTAQPPKLALIKNVLKENRPDDNLPDRCEMHHLAYVMFTSGSTGTPKGAMVEHAGMVNHNYSKLYDTQMDESSVMAQNSPQSFDIMIWQFVAPMIAGAQVHIFPDEIAYNPIALLDEIERAGITILQIVPALLTAIVQEANQRGENRPKLKALKWVVPTGEGLPAELCRQWFRIYPHVPLLNAYGATECSDDQTTYAIHTPPPEDHPVPIMTIGTPIPNMRMYVLDTYLNPVPVGVIGELYVGGIGVGRGYLYDEERTNKAFIPDPFYPGMRLYKTADRGRFWPDGTIEFLGRVDFMVKMRGFRIELGEIESVLSRHPAVKKVAVIMREDQPGQQRLVAYVVPNEEVTSATLREHVHNKLPEYMVPSVFMFINDIPLTANGKLNRRALPVPDTVVIDLDKNYVAPRTETERVLTGLWADLLRLPQVGIEDDFFELGGHSLLIGRMVGGIQRKLGVKVPLTSLFEARTIAKLAAQVDQMTPQTTNDIVPVGREGALPLTARQHGLWFIQQLVPDSPAYNIPVLFAIEGQPDAARLESSLNAIIERHETLRTQLTMKDGQLVQIVQPTARIKMDVVDLTNFPVSEQEAEALRCLVKDARRPFDLRAGTLIRATLYRMTARHMLLATIHHIVSDGWSMDIFSRELAAYYEAFSLDKPVELPALAVQYADYASWESAHFQDEILEQDIAYWSNQFAGDMTVAEVLPDFPRPPMQTFEGSSVPFVLPQSLADTLAAYSQRQGVTLFTTILSVLYTLLYRYTNSEQITIGTAMTDRTRPEIENLIGFFVNTLPLRINLSPQQTFGGLVEQVREMMLGAFAHQTISLDELMRVLKPERDNSRTAFFQMLFSWEDDPLPTLEAGGLTLTPTEMHNGTAKFDLSLYMQNHGGKLTGFIEYNTALFATETIERMVAHFQLLLEGAATKPDQHLLELPLLTAREYQQVMVEWNSTQADYPRDMCIHPLFEAQATRTPDAVALRFKDQSMTYRELNQRANQMAHYLSEHGVGPDVIVGICVEPSMEMVVGLLGVLKAGGAYLPLDPNYPTDRLAFMVEDARAKIILSETGSRQAVPESSAEIILLDADWNKIAQKPQTNPSIPLTPDSAMYITYTSGSTGRPKGVVGLHRGAVNRFTWMWQTYPFVEGEVGSQKTTLSFVDAVWEIFGFLLQGVPLVIFPREVARDPQALVQMLAEHKVTRIVLVPSMISAILDIYDNLERVLPDLKWYTSSGESLPVSLARRFREAAPNAHLLNLYGSSEVAADVTCFEYTNQDRVYIGRPISNTQIYILDTHRNLVSVGTPGELYVGGDNLARGYLYRPDLTADKFVPNPFSTDPTSRLYKSGDVARYLPDGNIEIIGRTDYVVKIRGFRIELNEIEAVLEQHPVVQQAVVSVFERAPGDKFIVAYVSPKQGQSPTAAQLRDFLRQTLPDYMIPASFMMLDVMPLTPNGKVNRRALPAPDTTTLMSDESYLAPRDSTEQTLAAIWAEVLGLPKVGVRDNFFELGGHSLLAVRVFSQIEKKFGKELPLAVLFRAPTVEALAKLIGTPTPAAEEILSLWAPVVDIQPNGTKPPFFCLGGGVLNLYNLARYLGNDQPFHALQTESLDGYQAVQANIEEMGAFFVKALRSRQPHGPYYLGGAYDSGILILEVARQLEADGETVAFMALFNTRPGWNKDRSLGGRIAGKISLNPIKLIANLRQIDMLHVQQSVQDQIWRRVVKICRRFGWPLPRVLRGDHYEELLVRRVRKGYAPEKPYAGPVTLFYTHDWYSWYMDEPKWGWGGEISGGLTPAEVPGVPCFLFLDPHVAVLAKSFKAHLERAQQAAKS